MDGWRKAGREEGREGGREGEKREGEKEGGRGEGGRETSHKISENTLLYILYYSSSSYTHIDLSDLFLE